MYLEYFGMKELAFSITPDPHYLYLSHRHREALAHLLYGAGGNGFVLLTGEVGTGKTTVCRAFLEQCPDELDIALILNPSLSVNELLQSICQEFGLPPGDANDSNRTLLDRLNHYLLDAHANNRRPVLLIDEAQNLSRDVLEQIRLLTNLETDKHKLLQIFLVGQPELREMLQRDDLRQLAQRVTARYHLQPLDRQETAEYIQHRLAVAGAKEGLFSKPALKRAHELSGGVPRLVNIICDRALLGAYATRKKSVGPGIVSQAARELAGEGETALKKAPIGLWLMLLLSVAALAIYWLLINPASKTPDAPKAPTSGSLISPPAEPVANLPANHFPPPALVNPRSPTQDIHWLNEQLAQAGYQMGDFDQYQTEIVHQFQSDQHLEADGIAGQDTLIRLQAISPVGD